MPNYRESQTKGVIQQWRRLDYAAVYNHGIPSIVCNEQDRTVLPDGRIINEPVAPIKHELTDPGVTIPLVNPDTYEPTEQTITAGEVYAMLASIYLWMARNRDAAAETPEEEI